MSAITEALGIDSYIVLDETRSFAGAAVDMLRADGWNGKIIDVSEALTLMTRKTLLIVVDTHKSGFVDFPSLYEKASATVVIDHQNRSIISRTRSFSSMTPTPRQPAKWSRSLCAI